MHWQLKIQEPSGEIRFQTLSGAATLGRAENNSICLRDPTIAPEAGILSLTDQTQTGIAPYWIKTTPAAPPIRLGDLQLREGLLPAELPFWMGETRLIIQPRDHTALLPEQPSGIPHWLTCESSGEKILWMAKKSAKTQLSIYLAGETGTGKEVLAHLIHAWSERSSGPFVPINCAALPLSLAESELFGHVKGAFTGAIHQRPGALMQAHGGTLFLDEVADLPLDIQVKLLRFLENGEIRPIGADRPSRANVRLLCATHRPLLELIHEGKFRRDLYYRLASVTLEIPPLRSRVDDIAMLARKFAQAMGYGLSSQAVLRLQAHSWPGNVRELRHAVERACGLSGPFSQILGEDAFEFLLTPEHIESRPELELKQPVLTLAEMERVMLLKALRLSRGNRASAAKILGVARSTLFEMLKRHRVQGPRMHQALYDRAA